MLSLQEIQVQTLKQSSMMRFKANMVAHCLEFSPKLTRVLGEEQLNVVVSTHINKANSFGITQRGPVRLFIDLCFLFGSGFHDDPQYPWANEILKNNKPNAQMATAKRLHEEVKNYVDNVSGEKQINTWNALKNVCSVIGKPFNFSKTPFTHNVLDQLNSIHPFKALYIGDAATIDLINSAKMVSHEYGFDSEKSCFLLCTLMYFFGHACINDPLYPWIERTLKNDKITDSTARAMRLEKKSITWLNHVLADVGREHD